MLGSRLVKLGLRGTTAALRRANVGAQQVRTLRYIGFKRELTLLQKLSYFVGGAAVVGTVVHNGIVIEEVVFTKRTRWMLNASPRVDITLGRDTLEDCLAEHGSYKKSVVPEEQQIQKVVEERFAILKGAALDLAHLEWEVHVVDKDEPNAFCLPGGKMCVYTGLLQFYAEAYQSGRLKCHPLDALDAVLAHEMAHAICRHGIEKIKLLPFLSIVADSVSGPLLHYLTDYIVSRPYSRALEEEADHVGMVILARACLDPSVVPESLKALSTDQEEGWDELETMLSTHPQGEVRKRLAMEKLPGVIEAHMPSTCVKVPSPSNKVLLEATREKKADPDIKCSNCTQKDPGQGSSHDADGWKNAWLTYLKAQPK